MRVREKWHEVLNTKEVLCNSSWCYYFPVWNKGKEYTTLVTVFWAPNRLGKQSLLVSFKLSSRELSLVAGWGYCGGCLAPGLSLDIFHNLETV